jgi:hypothetical protein
MTHTVRLVFCLVDTSCDMLRLRMLRKLRILPCDCGLQAVDCGPWLVILYLTSYDTTSCFSPLWLVLTIMDDPYS